MKTEMRTYERTHPWIIFGLNLETASYRLWMLLAEAQSKCDHLAGVPLLPSVARTMQKVYLAKGALATTAIEGNTLTEEQVKDRIDGKLDLPPSQAYLGQEIDNVVEACNLIADRVLGNSPTDLYIERISEYNALVLKELELEEDVIPGTIREHNVVIGRYRGAPPEDCEYLLGKLCNWLNEKFDTEENELEVAFGILKAIMAHIYMAWIHPFGDGNGRTARLMEFQVLLSVGIPTNAAHLLSNHYNQTRSDYYRQLDRTHRSRDVLPFVEYALRGFVDGLREQIEMVVAQQMLVHWINYVHDRFRNQGRVTQIRQRRLVLDLTCAPEPTPLSEIRHVSPRIAEEYAGKTNKTVKRDINKLKEMGLVIQTPEGIRVAKETMLAFLPRTRSE